MEDNADLDTNVDLPQDKTPSKQGSVEKDWKKGSRLLSGLVGCNALLFSCALLTCVFTEDIDIFEKDFHIFLSIMMVSCILWMLFQMYFTWKYKDAVLFKDCQAGPIWMRAGIVLFGVGALIMISFKIAHRVEYNNCATPTKITQPVIQAVFVIIQTCFLWVSCKHCVQIYLNATRCFMMVLLTVNLTIWILLVTEESRHHTTELQEYFNKHFLETNGSEHQSTFI